MREIDFLKAALHFKVRVALEDEYGSLENALVHFQGRFGKFAPRIMAETHPEFLDPIALKTRDGCGFNFLSEHMRRPWSLSEPRPGSMAELLVKHGFLAFAPDKRVKLALLGEPAKTPPDALPVKSEKQGHSRPKRRNNIGRRKQVG